MLLLLACSPSTPTETAPDFVQPIEDDDAPVDVVDDDEEPEPDDTAGEDSGETPLPELEDPPQLYLNEVMTNNTYSLKVSGDYPDWIEIYNASQETVALTRVAISDSSGRVWMGTEGELLPGAWVLVYADGTGEGLHAPFSLDGDGDTLILSVDGASVDRMATGELPADVSWARFPDGGDWAPTAWITAGETNGSEPSPTLDPSESLFSLNQLHTISFDVDSAGMSSLNSSPRTYVEGGMTIGSAELDPVGLRLRGSMTYQPISGKAAFKVDLNRYEDFRFGGQEKWNLLNMYYEPSYIREYLGYHIFREAGVPAIRNAYAWVDLNGTDYGLYMLSQAYDDTFLREWYGNADGYLWEPNSGDFTSGGSGWDCEEGECDTSVITPIRNLLASSATDANVADLENYMDLDSVLREIAIELAIGQWDGYCSPHNYRVYYNPDDGLVTVLPSSLDLTFDNYGDYGDDLFSCGGRVLGWCLSNDTCEERYYTILEELADMIEANDHYAPLIDELELLIDDAAQLDATTRAQYDYARHQTDVQYVRDYLLALPDYLRTQVDSRR